MIRTLIVESNPQDCQKLTQMCRQVHDVHLLGACHSGMEAINTLENQGVDLLFMNVELPDFSAFDFLANVSSGSLMVLMADDPTYAAMAFQHLEKVADYLVKPFELPRLMKTLQRCKKWLNQPLKNDQIEEIFIKVGGKYVKILLNDLIYIETVKNYVVFYTRDRSYLMYSTLKNIDGQLNNPQFVKVHRSYIVNTNHIVGIDDNSLLIFHKGKETDIPISRSKRPELMQAIHRVE